jgi:hypothetical protein
MTCNKYWQLKKILWKKHERRVKPAHNVKYVDTLFVVVVVKT